MVNNKSSQFHPAVSGEWIVFCDICGKKCYSSETIKRWDGFMVCLSDNDPVPPNRFIPNIAEVRVVENARPTKDVPISNTPTPLDAQSDGWYNPTTPST